MPLSLLEVEIKVEVRQGLSVLVQANTDVVGPDPGRQPVPEVILTSLLVDESI